MRSGTLSHVVRAFEGSGSQEAIIGDSLAVKGLKLSSEVLEDLGQATEVPHAVLLKALLHAIDGVVNVLEDWVLDLSLFEGLLHCLLRVEDASVTGHEALACNSCVLVLGLLGLHLNHLQFEGLSVEHAGLGLVDVFEHLVDIAKSDDGHLLPE